MNRPTFNRPNININNRPGQLPNRPGWDNNKWGNWGNWNNNNIINNRPININNNFRNNNNWGYRPNYWGNRPWWGCDNWHNWHNGHWNCGWNDHWYHNHWHNYNPWPGYVIYDDDDWEDSAAWGIAAWSLGSLIYNSGYQTYSNPYPAPAVQTERVVVDYSQPISVVGGENPPGDAAAEKSGAEKSSMALERSRDEFKRQDYLAALKSADEAISYEPSDAALHEYRALILFALGKYTDAAGVLNPALASGPGWDWTTMIGFYDSNSTYNDQLKKLEAYVKKTSSAADARFLLGYHYMVCGHLPEANEQFAEAAKLQPSDKISAQLRDLTGDSIKGKDDDSAGDKAAPAAEPAEATSVDPNKIVGNWTNDRGKDGKVTLKLGQDGKFVWNYARGDKSNDLTGSFTIDDRGLLVLKSEDSQMSGNVTMPEDNKMNFVLAGGPSGDPGLAFARTP